MLVFIWNELITALLSAMNDLKFSPRKHLVANFMLSAANVFSFLLCLNHWNGSCCSSLWLQHGYCHLLHGSLSKTNVLSNAGLIGLFLDRLLPESMLTAQVIFSVLLNILFYYLNFLYLFSSISGCGCQDSSAIK